MDLAAAIDEGINGWLTRHADGKPSTVAAEVCNVMMVADRVVADVTAACERWDLTAQARPGQSGWTVLTVTGRPLPVMALGEVVAALRWFGARPEPAAG